MRIRQGDWRVVYEVDDENRIVTAVQGMVAPLKTEGATIEIIKIGHRREVYR